METQLFDSPKSDFSGSFQVWQAQENISQTWQHNFYGTQQPQYASSPSNLPGLSTPSSQPPSQFISTEEQHDLLRRTFLGNLPKDEPRNGWVTDAIEELKHIDEEVAEEALPEISADTKEKAKRIIWALPKHPIAPAIYPTMDGEIAIYFKSPDVPSSVLILVGNDGQAACFSCINGENCRVRYENSSKLPGAFVEEQLQALKESVLPKDV